MHKSATKCNETVGKWCKNKHGASKIIDTFETYHQRSRLGAADRGGGRAGCSWAAVPTGSGPGAPIWAYWPCSWKHPPGCCHAIPGYLLARRAGSTEGHVHRSVVILLSSGFGLRRICHVSYQGGAFCSAAARSRMPGRRPWMVGTLWVGGRARGSGAG
jgi:hypothetical protein